LEGGGSRLTPCRQRFYCTDPRMLSAPLTQLQSQILSYPDPPFTQYRYPKNLGHACETVCLCAKKFSNKINFYIRKGGGSRWHTKLTKPFLAPTHGVQRSAFGSPLGTPRHLGQGLGSSRQSAKVYKAATCDRHIDKGRQRNITGRYLSHAERPNQLDYRAFIYVGAHSQSHYISYTPG
jgi:hypothetical protein